MNPYLALGTGIGTSDAAALSVRLASWHDAMVAHERALRSGHTGVECDDECPHGEARTLWSEAVATYGAAAEELGFLRSRATGGHDGRPSIRRTQSATDDLPDRSFTTESIGGAPGSAESWP